MNSSFPESSTGTVSVFNWMFNSPAVSVFLLHFVTGLLAHGGVAWLILREARRSATFEIFMLNLSISEMLNCLNYLILVLSVFSQHTNTFGFLQGVSVTARPLFQCLMCVERFLAVVHPVTFLKLKPLRYRIFCCSVAWTITLASCLCCLFIFNAKNMTVYLWFFVFQFMMFLPIQLFCCVSVLRALKQSGPGERKEENLGKRRAFNLIFITSVNLVVMYLPYIVIGFFNVLAHRFIQELWFAALFVYALSSYVQPVVYLHRSGKLSCICPPLQAMDE